MSGLGHLAWRSLAERRGRAALTLVGLVLGVALFTSSLVSVATADTLVSELSKDAMGSADVMASAVGGGGGGLGASALSTFPSEVAERLAALPGVEASAALISFPTSVATAAGRATKPRLNSPPPVVLAGGRSDEVRSLFGVQLAAGRFYEQAGEVIVPVSVADDLGLTIGEAVSVDTPTGRKPAKVVGTVAERGVGRIGTLAFADLSNMQDWAGRPGGISQLGLRLQPDVDRRAWMDGARTQAGDVAQLDDLNDLLAFTNGLVATVTGALTTLGAAVVFLGGFLLYLTMSMAVIERTRLYGLLAALGATRRQVRRLVVAESTMLGAVAGCFGLPLGVALAAVIRTASARLLLQAGGGDGGLVVPWWAMVGGAVVSIVATAAAGFVPARRAASLDPVEAIRTGTVDDRPTPRWVSIFGGVVLATGTGTLALGSESPAATSVGFILVLIGSVLLTPLLLRPLAALLGRGAGRLSGGVGDVAVRHLTTHRSRSAYTLALVMLVMALTIAAGATHTSFVTSLDRQIDREFGNDLVVEAATAVDGRFVDEVADIDGVEGVTTSNFGTGYAVDGSDEIAVQFKSVDPATFFDVASFSWVDGNDGDAQRLLAAGGAVIVPAGLAARLGSGTRGTINLRTREGVRPFKIAGTAEVTNIPPTLEIAANDASRYFGIEGALSVQVNVAPRTSPEEVRAAIEAELGGETTFIVTTSGELKADARAQVAGGLNAVFVLLALAAIVGVLGLANTMAMSVLQRTREIGVLRALGARARDIRTMVAAEALTLVAVAFVLAVPLGVVLSGPLLAGVRHGLGDTTVPYAFPWATFPVVALAGVAGAVIASLLPAQRAVHVDVDATLRFD